MSLFKLLLESFDLGLSFKPPPVRFVLWVLVPWFYCLSADLRLSLLWKDCLEWTDFRPADWTLWIVDYNLSSSTMFVLDWAGDSVWLLSSAMRSKTSWGVFCNCPDWDYCSTSDSYCIILIGRITFSSASVNSRDSWSSLVRPTSTVPIPELTTLLPRCFGVYWGWDVLF